MELWAPEQRSGRTLSNSLGEFGFSPEQSRGATGATLSRLGFETRAVALVTSDTLLQVQLEERPVALPELTVTASDRVCPKREEAQARTLWQRVRARYATGTAKRGIAMRMLRSRQDLLAADRVGAVPDGDLSEVEHRQIGAMAARLVGYASVNAQISELGYARRTGLDRPAWAFVELHSTAAHHFVSPAFGDRHTFSIREAGESEMVLEYCPRSPATEQPEIEGVLIVNADNTLRSARWRFRTTEPHEDAGGEVTFTPYANGTGDPPHLLAARGLFWRRHWKWTDRFHQTALVFTAWRVSDTDSMPDFPVRKR